MTDRDDEREPPAEPPPWLVLLRQAALDRGDIGAVITLTNTIAATSWPRR